MKRLRVVAWIVILLAGPAGAYQLPACTGEATWYGAGTIQDTKAQIVKTPFFQYARKKWRAPQSCVYGDGQWEIYFRNGSRYLFESSSDVDYTAYTLAAAVPLTETEARGLVEKQARSQANGATPACRWDAADVVQESRATIKAFDCSSGWRVQLSEIHGMVTQLKVTFAR